MAKVRVKLQPRGNIFSVLKETILSAFGKKTKGNFGRFRPLISEAIDDGVINARFNFIPTDSEAAELGIGEGGSIDRSRTQGAWRQLLTGDPSNVTTFTVRQDRRKDKIGVVSVKIDEGKFFAATLSNIDTPDSDKISSIPWMEWMIKGEVNSNYEFSPGGAGVRGSRTGGGIMVRGGIWTFAPVRLTAFSKLESSIEFQLFQTIRKNIGKVIL